MVWQVVGVYDDVRSFDAYLDVRGEVRVRGRQNRRRQRRRHDGETQSEQGQGKQNASHRGAPFSWMSPVYENYV
jgi:hypothetical protein